MVENNEDDVFKHISDTFSTTDIRTVYKFVKMIGGGHFGSVRTAHPKSDPDVTYAVKSILRENIKKDIKMLEEELSILAKADHPNIVKFHQSFIDYRYVHIVMEHCTGGELFDRIVSAQRFNENQAAEYMRQILSAVKHLHEHNIVHRDLKPENFLMSDKSDEAEVKMIDFGLSKRFQSIDEAEKMKTVVGTPYYVAPEVLKGNYDKSCDIWSLGVILFVFLCGYPPFEGDNNKEIFRNVLKQPLTFDPADWNSVSEPAKDLVSRMLEKDPSKRISAIDALNHIWFSQHTQNQEMVKQDKMQVLRKIRGFRAPKKLQYETISFLVTSLDTSEFDLAALTNAFRSLDTDNSGTLQLSEIKTAFDGLNLSTNEISEIFEAIDVNHDGEINYSEFLTVTADRRRVITEHNLLFAFHHFDIDNTGYITEENLEECFRREGKHLLHHELQMMLNQVDPKTPGRITYEEFCNFMKEMLNENSSPTLMRRLSLRKDEEKS